MEIYTNSPRVRQARKTNLQLILSQHDCRCATCIRSGNCTLQKLANDMNLLGTPYETELPIARWNQNLPLIRDAAKCVKCMRCIQICDKVQSLNIWDVAGTGSRTTVNVLEKTVSSRTQTAPTAPSASPTAPWAPSTSGTTR